MSSTRCVWGKGFAAVLGAALVGYPQLGDAQEAHSPLAGATQGERFPNGSERPQPQYEKVEGEVKLQLPEPGMARAVVAFGVAAHVQSRLPEGFTLGRGDAVRVMVGEQPAARAQEAAALEARDPMAVEGPRGAAGRA